MKLVTFTGFNKNNPLGKFGDINLWADSFNYNYVEMSHHIWLVSIVDYLASDEKNNE